MYQHKRRISSVKSYCTVYLKCKYYSTYIDTKRSNEKESALPLSFIVRSKKTFNAISQVNKWKQGN